MKELVNDSNTWLVDVRNPEEVAEQSVDGAENIPLHTVPDEVERFKNANKPIVLFCRSGNRSGQAKMFLEQQGVTDIHNAGGIADVLLLKM